MNVTNVLDCGRFLTDGRNEVVKLEMVQLCKNPNLWCVVGCSWDIHEWI